ncbi:MAG: hypothetical protein IT522_13320 [Burkholderiales bacterium]|nr:hypothetical protein [Burkholderiales bacterium]
MTGRRHGLIEIQRSIVVAAAFIAASVAGAQPPTFEVAPAVPGAQLAAPALLAGDGYHVAEPVRVDRYLGSFELHSSYGIFREHGAGMLAIRVRELRAIEELKKVEGSSEFVAALGKSASGTARTLSSLVTDPATTVENIAAGAGTVLGRIGYSIKTGAHSVADAATSGGPADAGRPPPAPNEKEPPAFTGDPLGYNKARREWAKRLDIDPYTSNPVLRPLLDHAASATFAGNFTVSVTVGAVAAPLQYASAFDSTVRDAVWNQPPIDLAKANEAKLLRMGIPSDVIRTFLRNRWFTPTLQTALVSALDKLDGVAGRDTIVRSASTIAGEVPARFLLRSVVLLGHFHHADRPLASIRTRGIVPVARARDGVLVAAVAVDYLYWSEETAAFTSAPELAVPRRILLIDGDASPRAAAELSRGHWTVRRGLRAA